MDKALWVAEVLRRKVEGLHMIVAITEKKIVDVWEPREEGLVTVREERFLTILEVTLTKNPTPEQKTNPGYHEPLKIKGEFLTKESWERGEKEREEHRGERRERREQRDRSGERPRRPREEGEERGGERRRGRNRE